MEARPAQAGLPDEALTSSTTPPKGGFSIAQESQQSTAHGSGGASVEELARRETFWRIKRNGQLSYQGVSPDANLQDGEALLALKKDGSLRVQDSRMNLGDEAVISKFGTRVRMAARE